MYTVSLPSHRLEMFLGPGVLFCPNVHSGQGWGGAMVRIRVRVRDAVGFRVRVKVAVKV